LFSFKTYALDHNQTSSTNYSSDQPLHGATWSCKVSPEVCLGTAQSGFLLCEIEAFPAVNAATAADSARDICIISEILPEQGQLPF